MNSKGAHTSDRIILATAATTVVVLAGIAAAISYSHMRHLAEQHGEHGWRAHAFPLSVDGIEIVASLVLLHHRRAGTSAGVLPWVALAAGTLASLAANVAVGGSDLIGRAVAGWPALALLVAIKLLAGLFDSRVTAGASTRPDQAVSPGVNAPVQGAKDGSTPAGLSRSRPRRSRPRSGATRRHTAGPNQDVADGTRTKSRRRGPRSSAAVRRTDGPDLEAAARAAFMELRESGERLTRDTLTRALRDRNHAVSNARAGELLAMLRATPATPVNGVRPDARLHGVGHQPRPEG